MTDNTDHALELRGIRDCFGGKVQAAIDAGIEALGTGDGLILVHPDTMRIAESMHAELERLRKRLRELAKPQPTEHED